MTESKTLEPVVIDTIERYFDLLQGHVSSEEMLKNVLTDDFETGFVDGFHWRGPDGLAEFLDARSVFFDESHEVLQLIDVTDWTRRTLRRGRACGSSCGGMNRVQQGAKSSPDRHGTPGDCAARRRRAGGEWRHKLSMDSLS